MLRRHPSARAAFRHSVPPTIEAVVILLHPETVLEARSPRGSRRTDKVRTSISAAPTCMGATLMMDAAAKVLPPRETSTLKQHEEVMSPGSTMMASLVLKRAVSSKTHQREPGQCLRHVKPPRELGEEAQRLPFGKCPREASLLPCHPRETCKASVRARHRVFSAWSSQKERGVVRPKFLRHVSFRGGHDCTPQCVSQKSSPSERAK